MATFTDYVISGDTLVDNAPAGRFVYSVRPYAPQGAVGQQYITIGYVRVTNQGAGNVVGVDWQPFNVWVKPGAVTYMPVYNSTGGGGGPVDPGPTDPGPVDPSTPAPHVCVCGVPHIPSGDIVRLLDQFNIPETGYGSYD